MTASGFLASAALLSCLVGVVHADLPSVTVGDARVVEGDSGTATLRFEIAATGPPRRATVAYQTHDGSTTLADSDYVATSGTLSLDPVRPELVSHWGTGLFGGPYGLALMPNGDLLAVDGVNSQVLRFGPDGSLLQTIGGPGHLPGQFFYPVGIAVNSQGEFFVVDNDDRCQKFGPDGNFLTQWGTKGSGAGQFNSPWGVAVDAHDVIYITEVQNHRVSEFNSDGTFVRAIPTDSPTSAPLGIAIDHQGRVLVSMAQSGIVLVLRPEGSLITAWNDTHGRISAPALHVDAAGNLLIADALTSRVVVLDSTGVFLTEWDVMDGTSYRGAEGIVADDHGNVYVASTMSNSVAHFVWNQASATIEVPVLSDTRFEADESLTLEITGAANATVARSVAIGTIVNDDPDFGPELAANGTFDVSLAGWSAYQGATLDQGADGIGGSNPARLTGPANLGTFGLNDTPDVVDSTVAGGRYHYQVWVRAVAAQGRARLRVREYHGTALQATTESVPVPLGSGWQRLSVVARTQLAGSTLDFQVLDDPKVAGEIFVVDDVSVRQLRSDVPPVVTMAPEATGSWLQDIVVQVTAHDPDDEPLQSLSADLSALHGATFTASSDATQGTLRWHPGTADIRVASYPVTVTAGNASAGSAPCAITVSPNVVLNGSFATDLAGWTGHAGATPTWLPDGRFDAGAARITLPATGLWQGLNDSPDWLGVAGFHQSFVIAAWVRSIDSQGDVRLMAREWLGPTLVGSASFSYPVFSGEPMLSPTWRRLILSYTSVATGPTHVDLAIDAQPRAAGETFDVDDVMIYSVGVATVGVPPAPDAIAELAPRVRPNPSRGGGVLEFALAAAGPMRVEVFDLAGRRVRVLANESRATAGMHRFAVGGARGERLAAGIYWARITAARESGTARFVVLE